MFKAKKKIIKKGKCINDLIDEQLNQGHEND